MKKNTKISVEQIRAKNRYKSTIHNVRLSCFQEVWQKWCESKSTQEFDEWLHAQMNEA